MGQQRFVDSPTKIIATVAVLAAACMLVLAGCGGGGSAKEVNAQENLASVLKKGIKPNEMGEVMVLEYHRFAEKEANYQRSYENFKKDLDYLYKNNYRLISFHDLLTGNIDTPAGTTPVVFSFDDSVLSQINYTSGTALDPNCGLGMLEAFHKQHPDFGYTGLFNVLPEIFDQPKYKKDKLDYLTSHGFEIGNHTISHPLLANKTDDQVQAEIAGLQKDVQNVDPKIKIDVLCLPYGSIPKNQALMYNGSSGGVTYHNNWSLLVGSDPFYPVYHYKSPGQLVPRVQVMDYDPRTGSGADGSGYWLRYFERRPELRFISDGDPKTICAPAYMQSRLVDKNLPKGVQFLGY